MIVNIEEILEKAKENNLNLQEIIVLYSFKENSNVFKQLEEENYNLDKNINWYGLSLQKLLRLNLIAFDEDYYLTEKGREII